MEDDKFKRGKRVKYSSSQFSKHFKPSVKIFYFDFEK